MCSGRDGCSEMCSACAWQCQVTSYWLPGGHQFLADVQLQQLGRVPVAFATSLHWMQVMRCKEIKKVSGVAIALSTGKDQQKNLRSATPSLLKTGLEVGVETQKSQFCHFKIYIYTKVIAWRKQCDLIKKTQPTKQENQNKTDHRTAEAAWDLWR